MKSIKILGITKTCMGQKFGMQLRGLLENAWDEEQIILNFEGIKLFASPFFNVSIGYFVSKYGRECFENKVKIINISDLGLNIIEQVKKNSSKELQNKDKILDIINNLDE
ncbi:STAS-like domain-containing protein [Clostridium sp.]|uniref:STAS-like domain-containing protein n=1 Tax=Clostridium sp. TaxID=1506 RepID=UPI0039969674